MDVASSEDDTSAPTRVKAQFLLKEHIAVLMEMFSPKDPVLRFVRGSAILEALYIFGDASGLGFGSSWLSGSDIRYRLEFGEARPKPLRPQTTGSSAISWKHWSVVV